MVVRPMSMRADAMIASLGVLIFSTNLLLVWILLERDSFLMTELTTPVNDLPCIHLVWVPASGCGVGCVCVFVHECLCVCKHLFDLTQTHCISYLSRNANIYNLLN